MVARPREISCSEGEAARGMEEAITRPAWFRKTAAWCCMSIAIQSILAMTGAMIGNDK